MKKFDNLGPGLMNIELMRVLYHDSQRSRGNHCQVS